MAAVWLQDCGIISSGLGLLARSDAAGIADCFLLRATLTVQKHYAYEKAQCRPQATPMLVDWWLSALERAPMTL
ncbi:hypothetical protein [Bradyrhizobium australafricanum]|uniref:hypothetical protein n=1 Tax=Bradyrhizobium australafricanum TaxID=2821406 RepID=UPI001CE31F8F|nr:hypothetical protein [Bradyrhizobium australafricanum]MCA6096884.1 hypothetical protein [Bradyrhizobium australafricanum]